MGGQKKGDSEHVLNNLKWFFKKDKSDGLKFNQSFQYK